MQPKTPDSSLKFIYIKEKFSSQLSFSARIGSLGRTQACYLGKINHSLNPASLFFVSSTSAIPGSASFQRSRDIIPNSFF